MMVRPPVVAEGPLAIVPEKTVLPVPATVMVLPVAVPERFKAPKVRPPELLLVRVLLLAVWVLVPLKVNAPVPPTVKLRKVMALVIVRAELSELRVTSVLKSAAPVPKAASFPITTVPAPKENPPLKLFAPDRVSEPVPDLVKDRTPPDSLIAPESVIAPLVTPIVVLAERVTVPVRLAALAEELKIMPDEETPVPPPEIDSPTPVCPFRSNAPPKELMEVGAAVDPSPFAFPSLTIAPELIVVAPVYVLLPLRMVVELVPPPVPITKLFVV